MPFPFSYETPSAGRSGAQATWEPVNVESCVSLDETESGRIALEVPQGVGARPVKVIQRVRTAGTRNFLGIVFYNPGHPSEPDAPEYLSDSQVPVARKGRVWVYCENFTIDPALASMALFFARNAGDGAGNLRYGDNDSASCTAIPSGIRKVHDSRPLGGGASMIHVEIDF
jgi:hypothetical protein